MTLCPVNGDFRGDKEIIIFAIPAHHAEGVTVVLGVLGAI